MANADITQIDAAGLNRVRDLALVIWPAHYAPLIGAELIPPMVADMYSLDTLGADIRDRGHLYWIASVDGKDVGYASAYLKDGRLWIKKLYLLRSVRGMGLGKRFIAAIRNHYGRQHPQALYVSERNETAIVFYKSQGFAIESLEPVQMGPYHFEDYVMVRAGQDAAP
ncbi:MULTISPECIES: GNAT family N-acetyltransferase [unclassified Mesorhizobium]|uniref:GNAT family N-acetyltransferase n=1 Tax=unclassified Mesorhizobium TaxID=325217 RepID=UPI00142EE87B|nr:MULTISPECIES: GNAT family N-acetyltransferase [unclassified Mesorhizobium]